MQTHVKEEESFFQNNFQILILNGVPKQQLPPSSCCVIPMVLELQWHPLALLFAFLLFLFMAITRRGATCSRLPANLPPGPKPLPIIGSMHHLVANLPHRSLRDLARKHGALMHLKLGQVSTVVVSSPQMAKEFLKTHDLIFAHRPELLAGKILGYGCTDVVFSPYGEYWRQLRKICILELLSARRVQSFSGVREEEVGRLVQSIRAAAGDRRPVNLTEKLFALSSTIASRAAFGKKCPRHERFLAGMKEAIRLATGFNVADLFPSLEFVNVVSGMKFRLGRTHRRLDEVLDEIMQEHRSKKARKMMAATQEVEEEEDLVDVLLRIQEGDDLEFPLTNDNIKAVILDMFGAGTETTATSLVWTMAELMRHPRVMQKVQAEVRETIHRKGKVAVDESSIQDMTYLGMVVKESLRLHPPLPLLVPRLCSQRCEVGGYEIPAGARVLVNAWAIGRDPTHWKNAEEFDPVRFDGNPLNFKGSGSMEFIPFGAGRRICPGMQFGLANIELALAQLLYWFDWEIPDGVQPEDFDMAEALGVSVARKADLCLLAAPYVPPATDELM